MKRIIFFRVYYAGILGLGNRVSKNIIHNDFFWRCFLSLGVWVLWDRGSFFFFILVLKLLTLVSVGFSVETGFLTFFLVLAILTLFRQTNAQNYRQNGKSGGIIFNLLKKFGTQNSPKSLQYRHFRYTIFTFPFPNLQTKTNWIGLFTFSPKYLDEESKLSRQNRRG